MYSLVLKGKGPKGHSWKLVDGKRVYTSGAGGQAEAPAKETPSQAAPSAAPSQNAFPHETFHSVGGMFGGSTKTPNIVAHDSKANAENHEGFIHGHLEDSGYKHTGTVNSGGSTVSSYEHPDGSKATLYNGTMGGSAYLGYSHTAGSTTAASSAPSKPDSKVGVTGKTLLTTSGLNKIARLTDQNDHGGAIMAGAKMLGRDDLHAEAKKIRDDHMKAGGLTQDLMDRRKKVYDSMMDHAKANLHPSDYAKFHGSF